MSRLVIIIGWWERGYKKRIHVRVEKYKANVKRAEQLSWNISSQLINSFLSRKSLSFHLLITGILKAIFLAWSLFCQ